MTTEGANVGNDAGSEAGTTGGKGRKVVGPLTTEDIFSPGSQDDPVETDSGMDSPGLTTDLRPEKHDLQTTTTLSKA